MSLFLFHYLIFSPFINQSYIRWYSYSLFLSNRFESKFSFSGLWCGELTGELKICAPQNELMLSPRIPSENSKTFARGGVGYDRARV